MINYSAIRDSLKSGDLVFMSSSHWKARLVKWWTNSRFSHVAIVYKFGGRVFLIEAVLSGVRIYPLSNVKQEYTLVQVDPLDFTAEAEAYALKHIGDEYSQVQAVLAGAGMLNGVDDRWVCSELGLSILERCKFTFMLKAKLRTSAKTPQAIFDAVSSQKVLQISNA
jgi:uncharacterized protein YycO